MTESEALLGHLAGQIALELGESSSRPTLDPLIEGALSTVAIEIADDADQLRWTIQSQEPLHHCRAPTSMSLTRRRSPRALEHEDPASTPGVEADDSCIGTAQRWQAGQMADRSHG